METAQLVLLGMALGLDSLRSSAALGAMGLSLRRQIQMCLLFALADGLAPLAGAVLGNSLTELAGLWVERLGPVVLASYGIYVIWSSRRWSGSEVETGWMVLGLPLAFSLDNLIAGASVGLLGESAVRTAVILGGTSGLMAATGFLVSRIALARLDPYWRWLAGVAVLVVAVGLELRPD